MSNREKDAYFEIVNWKRAQPRMKGKNNDWFKVYTSLLEHDGFDQLSDSTRVLIFGIWMLATRLGKHKLRADPGWLKRRIPFLHQRPNLKPLYETGFLRLCGAPVATRGRAGETRTDKTRAEPGSLTGSGKKRREKKRRVPSRPTNQSRARSAETADRQEQPESPRESDAGLAEKRAHFLPRPAQSAMSSKRPESIGTILAERLPEHWQDPDAERFGWQIIEALGMPMDPDNQTIRSEWGAFASWWSQVKGAARADQLEELRSKAIIKAQQIAKSRSAKNRGAVWLYVMAAELRHYGIKVAQAGPFAKATRAM